MRALLSAGATARLLEVARLFLRLGATSFGGPAAHIALMEHEIVERRGWVSRAEFLDLLAATNLIPGPNSTEMALHLGHRRAGRTGLIMAGVCFISPAMLTAIALAWVYVRVGGRPAGLAVLAAVKPVLIPVILRALVRLGRTTFEESRRTVVLLMALAAVLAGVHELLVLLLAGLVLAVWSGIPARPARALGLGGWGLPFPALMAGAAVQPVTAQGLFLVFLKIGSVLYGSGYVLLAFLRSDLVERRGWLTETQLLDAVAIGQLLPGPLFTTATFIGYILGGVPCAVAATVGIFLPAFVLVALSGPLIPRLRRSPWMGAFLDGVTTASLALMAVVTWQLARAALVDPLAWAVFFGSTALLAWRAVNPALLVATAAFVGAAVWAAGLVLG